MSHFTVLVIGEDIEKQLAPFHEFECTGINDEYVQDVDVTQESIEYGTDKDTGVFNLEEALGYHGLEDKIVADESEVDRNGDHKYGYAIVLDGKLIKAVNRTNPNRQWDWWEVGGRWSGFFKLKPGTMGDLGTKGLLGSCRNDGPGYADSVLKRDIDFDAMRDSAGNEAAAKWDKARALMGDSVTGFVSWEDMRERHKGNIDDARKAYHAQAAKQALAGDDNLRWASVEDFLCSRDEYIQNARNAACTTFAVLKDGQWHERGSMGWWGCVSDEKDKGEWHREFSALVDSLPDETRLTVVDCHI